MAGRKMKYRNLSSVILSARTWTSKNSPCSSSAPKSYSNIWSILGSCFTSKTPVYYKEKRIRKRLKSGLCGVREGCVAGHLLSLMLPGNKSHVRFYHGGGVGRPVYFSTLSLVLCVAYAIIVPLPHTRVDNTNIYIPCYRVAYLRTRAFESSFRVLNLIGCRMSVLSRLGAMIYVAISKKECLIIFRRDYKILGFMPLYFDYGIYSLRRNNAEPVSWNKVMHFSFSLPLLIQWTIR